MLCSVIPAKIMLRIAEVELVEGGSTVKDWSGLEGVATVCTGGLE